MKRTTAILALIALVGMAFTAGCGENPPADEATPAAAPAGGTMAPAGAPAGAPPGPAAAPK